jgi:uncharacterized protein (TIGR01777 family)
MAGTPAQAAKIVAATHVCASTLNENRAISGAERIRLALEPVCSLADAPRMRIAVTGSSGLLGRATVAALRERGDEVVAVSRREGEGLNWSVEGGLVPADGLSGFDAVLHLAGENVGDARWTAARKRAIRDSRVHGTARVVEAIARVPERPRVLVSSAGSSIYGDRGDEVVDEASAPGKGDFLAEVCVEWEAEARKAEDLGTRLVILRTAPVLSQNAGALPTLRRVFGLGIGGRLGSGRQYFPWIHVDDWVAIALRSLDDERARGPYNACAPEPVTNAQLTATLARVLRRPAVLPVPAFALRLAVGELSASLLGGHRAVPRRLLEEGFEFRFPTLETALRDLLV